MSDPAQNSRIESLLKATALSYPSDCAIVEWDEKQWQSITYSALLDQSLAFSLQLKQADIQSGERVIIISHNRIQAVVALLGIWFAKGTAVLIDPDLPACDLEQQCHISDARFWVVEEQIAEKHATENKIEYLITIQENALSWQKRNVTVPKTVFEDCQTDIATLLFTSGTTGEFKGVMLTHANYIYLTQFYQKLSPKEGCSLTVLPLFHVAGLFCGILQPLYVGVQIALFRSITAEALQSAFVRYRPTLVISVPRLLMMLDQKISSTVAARGKLAKSLFQILTSLSYFSHRYLNYNLGKRIFHSIHENFGGRLKKILCGSAVLPLSVQKHFLSYGFEVLCSYGATETCGPITLTEVNHRWRMGNVGPCVDREGLKITSEGEVLYRGPANMLGYFRDTATTQQAMTEGYFHTRDLGRLDHFGNLYINGRIKELIVFSDGKKAMPEQIEEHYELIVGMKEYAVFGATKDNIPIAVLAYVLDTNSENSAVAKQAFSISSHLKSPYRISDVMPVVALPRSSTQKVKRHELERMYREQSKTFDHMTPDQKETHAQLAILIACFQSVMTEKEPHSITPDTTFAEYNVDSLVAVRLCEVINQRLGVSLSPTAFWFSHNIRELNIYLLSNADRKSSEKSLLKKTKTYHSDDIAIVAADGIFPQSPDFETFWKNLCDGKDVITEVPSSRWNNSDYYDAYPLAPGKTNARHGGFIELADNFPCEDFGIKPRIAASMDPQQKIILMLTKRLLENFSGKGKLEQWRGSKTSFFLGAGFPDYMLMQMKELGLSNANPYSGIGMSDFLMTARVGFHFGLEGAALLIKTACSSGLVAVHQAVRALQTHDCDAAIAGGINVIQVPEISVCLTKGGFLSADGHCKAFDADADGYVRSEGCGLVLLKRYDDAVAAGDPILSVIVGSAINQDGASNGITAPNGKAQIKCYEAALDNAGLSPQSIQYIESHGSGTQLGDAIEMQSIQATYDQGRDAQHPLWVGAVKSNIGHCESAAGIAGLLKTIGVLQHQLIPPNLHYQKPNPSISFERSHVQLPTTLTYFKNQCEYAAVSSFGVAGTNAHIILKAAKKKE